MSDDEDSVQKEQQLTFGAGIKRKRIDFIPASAGTDETPKISQSTPFGNQYLSIVFKDGGSTKETSISGTKESSQASESPTKQAPAVNDLICDICKLPRSAPDYNSSMTARPHEASIAHMVCLEHSHPPSHLDRSRQGIKYLSSYGWDPDSRLGLGASGEGIRAPIKAKVKNDTVGLGVQLKEIKDAPRKKVESLNVKQARKKDLEDRKKRERLQEMFYRNDDVEKYLGNR